MQGHNLIMSCAIFSSESHMVTGLRARMQNTEKKNAITAVTSRRNGEIDVNRRYGWEERDSKKRERVSSNETIKMQMKGIKTQE